MSRFDEIGMSQRVRLEWFEHTAQLVLAGMARPEIEAELQELLRDKLSVGGSAVRGNREKVITILVRTWVSVDADLEPLRRDGLDLLRTLPAPQHLPVHWGMVMAAYPFWAVVAETVGRLLRLQGSASASEVQRRVRELRGERDTVARAARRVLSAFRDWGVLCDVPPKGTYAKGDSCPAEGRRMAAFMIESLLASMPGGSAQLSVVAAWPGFFAAPLDLAVATRALNDRRFEVLRHASNEPLISRQGPPPFVGIDDREQERTARLYREAARRRRAP